MKDDNLWTNVDDELPSENSNVKVIANDIVNEFEMVACYYVCPEYLTGSWVDEDGDDFPAIVTSWRHL